jgi:hypothetical protein
MSEASAQAPSDVVVVGETVLSRRSGRVVYEKDLEKIEASWVGVSRPDEGTLRGGLGRQGRVVGTDLRVIVTSKHQTPTQRLKTVSLELDTSQS